MRFKGEMGRKRIKLFYFGALKICQLIPRASGMFNVLVERQRVNKYNNAFY